MFITIAFLSYSFFDADITLKETPLVIEKTASITSSELPFLGTWSRAFSMGEGVEQKVSYIIDNESIKYVMTGAMPMSYEIVMDTFVSSDNRWIGHKGETPYVIFVKDIEEGSINLFKKKVASIEEGLSTGFPSDTTRSKFTSWNVYQKQ